MSDVEPVPTTAYDLTVLTSDGELVIGTLLQRGFSTFQELEGNANQTVYRIWTSPKMTIEDISAWFPNIHVLIVPHHQEVVYESNPCTPQTIGGFRLISSPEEVLGTYDICLLQGVGFGWGEHPTTVLGLNHLQQYAPDGLAHSRCLDFGAGTGILSFAAARCGARSVDAVEVDDAAIYTLEKNCGVNQLTSRISIERHLSNCLGKYELILANMYVDVLLPSLASLAGRLQPKARLWVSGFTAEWRDEILGQTSELGLTLTNTETYDEWVGMTFINGPTTGGSH